MRPFATLSSSFKSTSAAVAAAAAASRQAGTRHLSTRIAQVVAAPYGGSAFASATATATETAAAAAAASGRPAKSAAWELNPVAMATNGTTTTSPITATPSNVGSNPSGLANAPPRRNLSSTSTKSASIPQVPTATTAATTTPPSLPVQTLFVSGSDANSRAPRVLVTGALGQLGLGLVTALRDRFGTGNVVASDIRKPPADAIKSGANDGPFVFADVLNYPLLERIVVDFRIDWIVHYSALLSAVGERNPELALKINIEGVHNVLELAKRHNLRLFSPSTIGAFGPSTPKENAPDVTIMRPNTIYGITKVHMELLGEYYNAKYGVDFRSVRYPGIISADTPPGGGTTDYAVDIFHAAVNTASSGNKYNCFLSQDTRLPMMYLTDCIDGTMQLLEADNAQLKQRTYNMTGFSCTPRELEHLIRTNPRLASLNGPQFEVVYPKERDFRQDIADSWPGSIDDTNARNDFGWVPKFDMAATSDEMIRRLLMQYKTANAASAANVHAAAAAAADPIAAVGSA